MKKHSTRSPLRILTAVLTSLPLLYASAAIAGYLPRTIWPLSMWIENPKIQCLIVMVTTLPILLFALSWETYEAKLLDPVILAPSQNLETIDIDFYSTTEKIFDGMISLGALIVCCPDILPWQMVASALFVTGAAIAARFQFNDF